MTDKLKLLYQTQILALSKNPYNEGKLSSYTHLVKAYNPLCGDQYEVYLNIIENRVIEASFTGYGCAISKASTSVLTKELIGKELEEIEEEINEFLRLLDYNEPVTPDEITNNEQLLAFAAARQFPERINCANLSWNAIKEQIL
jgi:nitrogen fixation NifU-like protein